MDYTKIIQIKEEGPRSSNSKAMMATEVKKYVCFNTENANDEYNLKDSFWIWDTGCTDHIHNKIEDFSNIEDINQSIETAGKLVTANKKGTVSKRVRLSSGELKDIHLYDVLYLPKIKRSLISPLKVREVGLNWSADNIMINKNETIPIYQKGRLFVVELFDIEPGDIKPNSDSIVWTAVTNNNITNNQQEVLISTKNIKSDSLKLWHARMGHLDRRMIKYLPNKVNGIPSKLTDDIGNLCECCELAKMTKNNIPITKAQSNVKKKLQLIHMDTGGPMLNLDIAYKCRRFLIIQDDCTKLVKTYYLIEKTSKEIIRSLMEFSAELNYDLETEMPLKIIKIRSDNGREFVSREFKDFCVERQICQEFSIPRRQYQNGRIERAVRTILETARSLLIQANLPKSFWMLAINVQLMLRTDLHQG